MPLKVFISAGEASGEYYGALLIDSIRQRLAPKGEATDFFGMGGPRMVAAGLDRVVRAEDMAVMGVTEVVTHLPRIYGEFRKLRQSIRDRRPDVAVLIDFPDIHLRLARELHSLGIPVVYFVSPQLWAWKKSRIEVVRKYVSRMVVIFPFEEAFYRDRGIAAEFVGHPLADMPAPTITREQYAKQAFQLPYDVWNYGPGPAGLQTGISPADPAVTLQLDQHKEWIALLPGSRISEINMNLREIVAAAHLLGDSYEFLIPVAPTLDKEQIVAVQLNLGDMLPESLSRSVRLVNDARAALHHARASIVASGTATVEAALIGNPFVVVYRVSPLTYAVAKRTVDVPHVAMVNLIAGKRIVPELIQKDFTASKIVEQIKPLLPDGPPRQSMMQDLEGIRSALRARSDAATGDAKSAIERLASIVLDQVGQPPS